MYVIRVRMRRGESDGEKAVDGGRVSGTGEIANCKSTPNKVLNLTMLIYVKWGKSQTKGVYAF